MTWQRLTEPTDRIVCDGCGRQERDRPSDWLAMSGQWGTAAGSDHLMGDFCPACVQIVGALLFPLSQRNRAVANPWEANPLGPE